MVLTRAALNEYDSRVQALGDAAYDLVRRRVESFMGRFPGASVAEARAFTIESVSYAVSVYGDAASTCAADLYDQMAEAAGASVQPAAIDTSDVSAYIEKEIRYQAGKLAEGKTAEFVTAAASKAKSQTVRRANDTMSANVKRDGVRYARVPMGGETCTFCLMLASQGFVYKSAKTAGEGAHYHSNCRCKVVPQFVKGMRATGVEGYDPDELYEQWKKFTEIDKRKDLPVAAREQMKAMLNISPGLSVKEAENKWVERSRGYVADLEKANSKVYRQVVENIVGEGMADDVWKDMRHTLKVKSGTPYECLYAYDITSGTRIAAITNSKDEMQVVMDTKTRDAVLSAAALGHDVVVMHNHPGSSLPSIADIANVARTGARFGVIACHDGSIIKFSPKDPGTYASYNKDELKVIDDAVERIIASKKMRGQTEAEYIGTVEWEAGAAIERFVVG